MIWVGRRPPGSAGQGPRCCAGLMVLAIGWNVQEPACASRPGDADCPPRDGRLDPEGHRPEDLRLPRVPAGHARSPTTPGRLKSAEALKVERTGSNRPDGQSIRNDLTIVGQTLLGVVEHAAESPSWVKINARHADFLDPQPCLRRLDPKLQRHAPTALRDVQLSQG